MATKKKVAPAPAPKLVTITLRKPGGAVHVWTAERAVIDMGGRYDPKTMLNVYGEVDTGDWSIELANDASVIITS